VHYSAEVLIFLVLNTLQAASILRFPHRSAKLPIKSLAPRQQQCRILADGSCHRLALRMQHSWTYVENECEPDIPCPVTVKSFYEFLQVLPSYKAEGRNTSCKVPYLLRNSGYVCPFSLTGRLKDMALRYTCSTTLVTLVQW